MATDETSGQLESGQETGQETEARAEISGALIGWARQSSRHGIIITLQVVHNASDYKDHRFHTVSVALNERQLRSLARDLARAARSRGLSLRARAPLHRRLWHGLLRVVGR